MIDHILFIYLSAGRHLGCFLFLAIMNSAVVNIREQVFAWASVFISLAYGSKSGAAGS